MQIVTMIIVSLLPLVVILWLIKKFTDVADDIRYLANRAHIENGDELPKSSRWVAVAAILLIIFVIAYSVSMQPTMTHIPY